jgi:hypothetical protein
LSLSESHDVFPSGFLTSLAVKMRYAERHTLNDKSMRSKGLGPEKYNLPRWETTVAPHIAFYNRDIKMLSKNFNPNHTMRRKQHVLCIVTSDNTRFLSTDCKRDIF